MLISIRSREDADEALDRIGLRAALDKDKLVLIKINLARPPEPEHPRTDPILLAKTIRYVANKGAHCAIAEGADGFLQENIEQSGLGQVVRENNVSVIDLDLEEFDSVHEDNEEHYLPKCLKNYAIRIGMPALTKRPGMHFSNNVKLFVGVLPRRMYQTGEPTAAIAAWRPRVHLDLDRSIANIYRAVMRYAPFHFFINGGKAMIEGQGEMDLQEILVGDNALEMDRHWLERFNLEVPEYVERLIKSDPVVQGTDR